MKPRYKLVIKNTHFLLDRIDILTIFFHISYIQTSPVPSIIKLTTAVTTRPFYDASLLGRPKAHPPEAPAASGMSSPRRDVITTANAPARRPGIWPVVFRPLMTSRRAAVWAPGVMTSSREVHAPAGAGADLPQPVFVARVQCCREH